MIVFNIPNANAVVSLILRQKNLKSLSTIAVNSSGAASIGGISLSYPAHTIIHSPGFASNLFAIGLFGAISLFFSVILLEENNELAFEFKPISQDNFSIAPYRFEEINTYNEEIDELNAIFKTIEEQTEIKKLEQKEIYALWNEYSKYLHPFTIKIAQEEAFKVITFVSNLKI